MKIIRSSIITIFCFTLFVVQMGVAAEGAGSSKSQSSLRKPEGTPSATLMNINKLSAWYESSGEQERDPVTGNAGVTYPRGTSTCIYASGLMWGGKVTDGITPTNRVNGFSYSVGTKAGVIKSLRKGDAEDPTAKDVRIWRIRRDYPSADLKQDAAEMYVKALPSVTDGDVATLRAQYKTDWVEWPWKKGAPYYDKDHDGKYTPKFVIENGVEVPDTSGDMPGIADADMVIWTAYNDIGQNSPWASPPIGLEIQFTAWGYNRSDALGNMIFKRYRVMYKGTDKTPANASIDNMYLCQWSDPDLGDAGDDFAGCDTTLSLGYIYNSKTLDKEYKKFNIAPPSAGYAFLQGPMVNSPGKTAVFDLKYRGDKENLPMTSFIYFAAGGTYEDPRFNANGAIQWYQMLRGLPPTPQGPPDPPPFNDLSTNLPTAFWLSGDPVTKKGWIDGKLDVPGDRRFLLTSGPFSMAVGDTQELVSALIAGLGADRLSSISVLKFYTKTTLYAYKQLFNLPKPPIAPRPQGIALDRGIILEWEKDNVARLATENSVSKGYVFEGYNVYQLPTATSPITNAKKLATYDIANEVTTIKQEEYDEASGDILIKPVQFGKNTGLTRYMYITQDAVKNIPLVNGQHYYFAVTAYNYNADPALTVHSYESSPLVLDVVPHDPNPGVIQPYAINDTLNNVPTTNVIGNNDATVGFVVFNPTLQTGATYDVWYGGSGPAFRNFTIVKQIPGPDYATVSVTLDTLAKVTTRPVPSGYGTFTINDAKTQISYSININGIVPRSDTSAHIFYGYKFAKGPVVKTLKFVSGAASGVWTKSDGTEPLNDSLVTAFTSGNLYIMMNTTAYPNGEIQGQIGDGLVPRADLPSPQSPPATVKDLSYNESRVPSEGASFYLAPAPLGFKSGTQKSPTTGNVINVPNPEGTYAIVGPSSSLGGSKPTESTIEFRFTADTNWAITVPMGVKVPTPPQAKYMHVPFAIYKDTTRVWPVILRVDDNDTIWHVDPANDVVRGKPTFNDIIGIADVVDGSDNNITYLGTLVNGAPPSSNGVKGKLINGVNHIAKDIKFMDWKSTGISPATGTVIQFVANKSVKVGDIKTFSVQALTAFDKATAKKAVSRINVFPNPYYGVNTSETNRDIRFVTFNHLPQKATIRIFNLAGVLVRVLTKNDPSQFLNWDLLNSNGLPVASGVYIIHINMTELGTTQILKLAVIMEQQFLQNY